MGTGLARAIWVRGRVASVATGRGVRARPNGCHGGIWTACRAGVSPFVVPMVAVPGAVRRIAVVREPWLAVVLHETQQALGPLVLQVAAAKPRYGPTRAGADERREPAGARSHDRGTFKTLIDACRSGAWRTVIYGGASRDSLLAGRRGPGSPSKSAAAVSQGRDRLCAGALRDGGSGLAVPSPTHDAWQLVSRGPE